MTREQALRQVGETVAQLVGIPALGFDDNDCICLDFDDVACNLVAGENHLVLHTELGTLSGFLQTAGSCRRLLALNRELEFVDGNAGVAIDRAADAIELCCVIRPFAALDAAVMEAAISRFLEVTEDLQARLQMQAPGPAETGASTAMSWGRV